jgi:hypothetical protein
MAWRRGGRIIGGADRHQPEHAAPVPGEVRENRLGEAILVGRFQSSNHMRSFETAAFFGLNSKLQLSSFMESLV